MGLSNTLADDALTNSSLYFWTFPSIIFHQSTPDSRRQFFDYKLNPFSYGYAMELGLEFNSQIKVTLIGQQILNADPTGNFRAIYCSFNYWIPLLKFYA